MRTFPGRIKTGRLRVEFLQTVSDLLVIYVYLGLERVKSFRNRVSRIQPLENDWRYCLGLWSYRRQLKHRNLRNRFDRRRINAVVDRVEVQKSANVLFAVVIEPIPVIVESVHADTTSANAAEKPTSLLATASRTE